MHVEIALIRASAGGSLQLLSLCVGGAFLARAKILQRQTCSSWSKAIFSLFLPSLLFSSILQTVHDAKLDVERSSPESFQLLIPAFWAVITLLTSSIVAEVVLSRLLREYEQSVRRVLFIALLLGNANNLPILLLDK